MSEQTSAEQLGITPITLDQSYLDGIGLSEGDPAEFEEEGEGVSREEGEEAGGFRVHNFHTGKIMVSVYEAEPGKVHLDGLPYDEFIQILEGRLILTPDAGGRFEYKAGDSLVIPRGYVGHWEMPEKYRELIIINADYAEE